MNLTKHAIQRTALAAAVATMLGTVAIPEPASAANLTFSVSGWFTMIQPGGTAALVNGDADTQGFYGRRTAVGGTMTFDTVTGAGGASITPFSFFGSGVAAATTITFQTIGDGAGGPGTLVLGNMGFNWAGNNGIPVSIVWDQAGLLNAINQGGLNVGDTVSGTGALAATDDFLFSFGKQSYTLPLGPAPVATTTFNTTDIGTVVLGTNPSGTLPLTDDGIGGSPMPAGPFTGFNANFDFTSLTLTDDGLGPVFTQPADVDFTAPEQDTPASINVDLGTVTDETAGVTIDYSTDGKAITDTTKTWVPDNSGTNTIATNATQTVTALTVDWRATSGGGSQSFKTQAVKVTITDTTAPVITSTPADVTVSVTSTSDSVCFGTISSTDAIDPNPQEQWSHDGFTWVDDNNTDNCSTGFGPNTNTLYWRTVDETGNTATHQQNVTLNLPTGIVGKACTIDLATAGYRAVDALFTMRDPGGAVTPAGTVDTTVTGQIDTTLLCTSESCIDVGADLATTQPFFGSLWTATPIRLFGQGTWTFEACPFPRSFDSASSDWVSPDGSTKCGSEFTANPISMTVGQGQLGAHMLFDWSTTKAIDVVVVWDVNCNLYQLTTTDPDGDGILSTPMVDGPFKGWNAAFDLKTQTGLTPPVPPIADGGFTTTIPAVQNPAIGKSPLPLTVTNPTPAVADPVAVRSCVGDCFEFTTTELLDKTDGTGAYQYVQAVLPLTEATPFWSQYRKFDNATQTWGPFTINGRNDVKTAPLDIATGACPEPGSGAYDRPSSGVLKDKLRDGDECVQLTIEDNGPNDSDPAVGTVADPGGVAEVPATPLPEPETSGGGCSLSAASADASKGGAWWLLAGFLTWLGWKRRTLKTH